jgi:pilus assembly protein Flp/PilA
MRNLIGNFLVGEDGATAIEYGLIAAGIAVAIIATVLGLGTSLNYHLLDGLQFAAISGCSLVRSVNLQPRSGMIEACRGGAYDGAATGIKTASVPLPRDRGRLLFDHVKPA